MKKLFISQPMGGLSEDEILRIRKVSTRIAESRLGEKCELIDSYIEEEPPEEAKNTGLWYLAKSLELLAEADVVFFAPGWRSERGCVIENLAAKEYGIQIIN